jgi:hypothetical protein
LAGGKARGQESVIDFPRYGEAIEHGWRQEQALIVWESVRRGVDVALSGRDNAHVIPRYALYLGSIRIEQPLLKISDLRFEGGQPFVDIEVNLVGEAAGYPALAKFALRIS